MLDARRVAAMQAAAAAVSVGEAAGDQPAALAAVAPRRPRAGASTVARHVNCHTYVARASTDSLLVEVLFFRSWCNTFLW